MNTINRIDISERFADMWRTSRESAGVSQDYMAKALGVSKKTVQNWEAGTSCPSQKTGFEWFAVLGLQPLPYYLKLIYGIGFELSINDADDSTVITALTSIVSDITPEMRKKLLYILAGDHGSSVAGVLDMVTAHLQTPLRDRLNIAQSINLNYELAEASGTIKCNDDVQPDIDFLTTAIGIGKDAVKEGRNHYTALQKGV